MDIKDDNKIIQWFNIKDLSEKSQGTYLIYMKKFCSCIDKNPTELIKEAEEETKKGLLLSERKTFEYLTQFKKCIKDLAPKSQSLGMAVVKSFYETFDIQLSSSIKKQKKANSKRENQNFLKKEDIEKMVTYAQNTRDKAIFLCMATSGMGLQEITNLRMSDITFGDDGISTISIRRHKVDIDLITFISPEATTALKEYFEERNRDPKLSSKGKKDYVFVTYSNGGGNGGKKGGQISDRAFTKIFKDLGNELGYDNGEDFVKTRSHALRKFFTSTLEDNGFPKPKVDFMVGHTVNDRDKAYTNRSQAELKELYIQYLPHLTFFEKTIEVRSLDTKDSKKLNDLESENAILKAKMEEMNGNKSNMESRLSAMEAMVNQLINARQKDVEYRIAEEGIEKVEAQASRFVDKFIKEQEGKP
ncbi:MAG: tyrosine-type recombinase/integrase [Candidatus Methanoperedens sp.]|nr:tyrosine-type recombinase/integrase [Candidatus Methanoperedens sp.]